MAEKGEHIHIVSDEIKALSSIFYGKGEFLVNGNIPDESMDLLCCDLINKKINNVLLGVQISCDQGNTLVRLNLTLNNNYPYSIPDISLLSTDVTRKNVDKIYKHLMEYINTDCLDCEPVVLKIVNWLQANVPVIVAKESDVKPLGRDIAVSTREMEARIITILKFDHMRARNKYLKCISRWMKELGLNGCIVFFGKEIIGIIEGVECSMNKYLKLLRTSTVDVDSTGKCCKERQMDILCQLEKSKQHSINTGFKIESCTSIEEFVNIFERTGLFDIYQDYIKH